MRGHPVTVEKILRYNSRNEIDAVYLARCECGWSEGWLHDRQKARERANEHRTRFGLPPRSWELTKHPTSRTGAREPR